MSLEEKQDEEPRAVEARKEEGTAEPREIEELLRMLMKNRLKLEAEFVEERRRREKELAAERESREREVARQMKTMQKQINGISDGPSKGVKEGRN